MSYTSPPDCPHCETGTVHVDKPWLDGVCVQCGRSIDTTAVETRISD
jgi:hypothetical protein